MPYSGLKHISVATTSAALVLACYSIEFDACNWDSDAGTMQQVDLTVDCGTCWCHSNSNPTRLPPRTHAPSCVLATRHTHTRARSSLCFQGQKTNADWQHDETEATPWSPSACLPPASCSFRSSRLRSLTREWTQLEPRLSAPWCRQWHRVPGLLRLDEHVNSDIKNHLDCKN